MSLFIAAIFLLQEKTAEETFQKLEKTILQAKTIIVRATVKEEGGGGEGKAVSVLLMVKEGDKGSVSFAGGSPEIHVHRISDGKKMRTRTFGTECDTPKKFTEGIARGLARMGCTPTFLLAFAMTDFGEQEKTFQKFIASMKVEEIKYGADDGKGKTLTYQVASYHAPNLEKPEILEATLTYDPETLKILKRTMKSANGAVTETYEEFTLNADIPDEKFKLPEK